MNIEKYYDLMHKHAELESNYAHMADLRDSALKELDEAQERIAELEKQLENSVIAPYDKHGNEIKVGDWVQWGNGKTKDPFEVICLKPDGDGIILNDKSFESCWRPDYAGYWEIVPEPDTIEKINAEVMSDIWHKPLYCLMCKEEVEVTYEENRVYSFYCRSCGHETTLTSRSEAAVREFYSKLNVEKEEK